MLIAGLMLGDSSKQKLVFIFAQLPLIITSTFLIDFVANEEAFLLPERYKVLSWNTALWDQERQSEFFEVMRSNESDFYLLQEVQYKLNRWVYYDILQEFKEYYAAHYGEYMILSKYPLQCEPPSQLGGYLHCEAATPDGAIDLFNVHLKRPFHLTNFSSFQDYDTRRWQFDELMTAVHGNQFPVIIGGDFNSTANYSFIRTLGRLFELNNPSGKLIFPHTFPTIGPYIRIDYQFVSSPLYFCGYEEIRRADLSDHIGILGSVCME